MEHDASATVKVAWPRAEQLAADVRRICGKLWRRRSANNSRRGVDCPSSRLVMKRTCVMLLAAVAAAATLPLAAAANPLAPREQDRASPYMRVYGISQAPYGFID